MKKGNLGILLAIAGFTIFGLLKTETKRNTPQSTPTPQQDRPQRESELIPKGPWPPPVQSSILMEADPVITNYYVIFDASGSMNEIVSGEIPKLEAGKRALVTFANNLPENANLGLLTFDPVREVLPLGRGNRQQFVDLVGQITAKGRTPLVESMFTGFNVLTSQAQKQSGYGRYILVIVTDGASSDGNPGGIASEIARKSSIEVQTIGFGVSNHALNLPGITQYVTAASPAALIDALNQVISSETESFVDPDTFQK